MKKFLVLCLIFLLLFTGCVRHNNTDDNQYEYDFSVQTSNIFPFYVIGNDDCLWRVENNNAYSLKYQVNYSNSNVRFVKYLKNIDTVIFATDLKTENGTTLCTLAIKKGNKEVNIVYKDIKLDSIRVQPDGNVLFIDNAYNLFFLRDGILNKIETNVIEGELVGEDTFLYRLKRTVKENDEILYPIYIATADYRNYLTDALDIVAADSENAKAYIIKNKRTIQKRTASVIVADCYIVADGELLFSLPSIVLSQFEESKHNFLLSCSEFAPTLKYNLYSFGQGEPLLVAQDVLDGKIISESRDVFAYETVKDSNVRTWIIDSNNNIKSFYLGENCSLDGVFCCGGELFAYFDKKITKLNDNTVVDENVQNIKIENDTLFWSKEKEAPFVIYGYINNEVKTVANGVMSENFTYKDENFYYYVDDGNDLAMTNKSGRVIALTSNVDSSKGFLCDNSTIALVKNGDNLYIVNNSGIIDTKLKVKEFI